MGYSQKLKKSNPVKNKAIILGLCPTGLSVARALGRKGVEVYGVDKERLAVGFFSRYCRRLGSFNIDDSQQEANLLRRLIEFGKGEAVKPVIFVTSDDFLVFLARHNEALQKYYLFPALDEEILDSFLNKEKFYKICSQNNIPIPETIFLKNGVDINSLVDKAPYPCIFKPIYTHIWDRKLKGLKAILAKTPSEFLSGYQMLEKLGMSKNIMVQKVIEGPADEIYIFASYFDKDSKPMGIFTGRKIRQYPADFGTTTSAVSCRNGEVSSMAVRLLKNMSYHGLCDVEFKRDKESGELKIMEINPRAGRWYGLVEASGINLVYSAYADLTGDMGVLEVGAMEEDKKWIFWERDIVTSFGYIKNRVLSIKDYYKSINGKRISAIYSKDDKLPAFVYPFNQVLSLIKRNHLLKT
jgi:predicted ATP-grasp superfamily ATP-dependent carboligase